jgi:hypothetical protein
MEAPERCPECGAIWHEQQTCQAAFHQMLYWENEHPEAAAAVHHLMVLCYYLQHPSLYSPEGLTYARQLLVTFVKEGATPQDVRRRNRDQVDSGKRQWKFVGTPASHGSYTQPIHWHMTAIDVIAGGVDAYVENVKRWAKSIDDTLSSSSGKANG